MVCPRHRETYAVGWRTGKTRCSVPTEIAGHKSSTAKGDRGISSSESAFVLSTVKTFLPVGTRESILFKLYPGTSALFNNQQKPGGYPRLISSDCQTVQPRITLKQKFSSVCDWRLWLRLSRVIIQTFLQALKYTIPGVFFAVGDHFLNFFFHFFAEDDHGMPCLSRPRQVHAISSNPFCPRNSALDLWLSFCYQSIIPSIEIWNRSCLCQSCKEIPRNRYSRPKDLEDKNSFHQWQVCENSLRIEAWKSLP